MGKAEREKGKRRERWLVKELAKVDIDAYRVGQYRAKRGDADVECNSHTFAFEVKDRRRLSVFPTMQQHSEEVGAVDIPVVVWYNPIHRKAVAILNWDEFAEMLGVLVSENCYERGKG